MLLKNLYFYEWVHLVGFLPKETIVVIFCLLSFTTVSFYEGFTLKLVLLE